LLNYTETRPQVTVYFQNQASDEQMFKLRDTLVGSGKTISTKYISKSDAFNTYKEMNKDNPLLLEMVSADILPASLEIYAKKPTYLSEIADFVKKQPGVDEVYFQKDIVKRLLSLTTTLRQTTITLFGFLLVMSVVVLTTTTLFKVALKKDEIELLNLLGASSWHIRKPFLKESLFFGFTAATTSYLIILGTLLYMQPFLTSYLRGIPTITIAIDPLSFVVWPLSLPFMAVTYALTLLFGAGIAFIATLLATQKYLD
ncbi:hypothetical protein HGB07_05500, partial [Candidatus Roizmanbacteria bacterium]|nr:hypothetical protein [Candidatus Roizmanbacteria bacterium]